MAKSTKQSGAADPAARVMRAVRKAEKDAEEEIHARIRKGDIVRDEKDRGTPINPGTGQTILKSRPRPIPKLMDEGKIGQIEIQAAADFFRASGLISSALWIRSTNLDRVDCGAPSEEERLRRMKRETKLVERYTKFQRAWTQRSQDYGDPTLAILTDAIVDQRWMRTMADDHGYRVEKIERAIIGGLRDYAARAGWVTDHKAIQWQAEAAAVFGPAEPELSRAVRRAAVER